MNKFKVAAIQLNSQDDLKINLEMSGKLINEAAANAADLVVLPEYANYLSEAGKIKHAEPLEGRTINFYREIAQKQQIHIHCGSFLEKTDIIDKAYNTSVLIDSQGEIAAVYRKMHLFDVVIPGYVDVRESNTIKAGEEVTVASTPLGTFGFTICYDLRFPELFQRLTGQGAQLIFVPAAFTQYTGKDHWEVLLRARAIENQVYIVSPGQFGSHPPGKQSYGNSMIVDPWGTVIARASEGIGYTIAEINWSIAQDIRTNLPSLKHKVLR